MTDSDQSESLEYQEFLKLSKNHRAKVYRAATKFQTELLDLVENLGAEVLDSVECLLSVLADVTSKSESEQYLEAADYKVIWQEIELHLASKVSENPEVTLKESLAEFGVTFPTFPEFGNSGNNRGGRGKSYFFKMDLSEVSEIKEGDI